MFKNIIVAIRNIGFTSYKFSLNLLFVRYTSAELCTYARRGYRRIHPKRCDSVQTFTGIFFDNSFLSLSLALFPSLCTLVPSLRVRSTYQDELEREKERER